MSQELNVQSIDVGRFDVTLVSCNRLPDPDPDEGPLLDALEKAELTVRKCVWDDPDVDWSQSRLTLIWSTWDYYTKRDEFVEWAEDVEQQSTLCNPSKVVRWNSHKRYLLTLPLRGVPVVPTVMIEGDSEVELAEICGHEKWQRIVVKPAVSAGSYETHAMDADDLHDEAYRRLCAAGDVLVQPYVDSVDDYGERSLVYIDGEFTHCVRKQPRFSGDKERVTGPHEPTERELAVADAAMDAVGEPLLYGRVDLVRNDENEPVVAELEVLEPSLFFRCCDDALDRMVDGIRRRLERW